MPNSVRKLQDSDNTTLLPHWKRPFWQKYEKPTKLREILAYEQYRANKGRSKPAVKPKTTRIEIADYDLFGLDESGEVVIYLDDSAEDDEEKDKDDGDDEEEDGGDDPKDGKDPAEGHGDRKSVV